VFVFVWAWSAGHEGEAVLELVFVVMDGGATLSFSPAQAIAHDRGHPRGGRAPLVMGEADRGAAQQDIADGAGAFVLQRVCNLGADIRVEGAERLHEFRLARREGGDIGGSGAV